jgi:hypothetical protein
MLEVFELADGKWTLLDVFSNDAYVAAPPFANSDFSLDLLWSLEPLPSKRPPVRARTRPRKAVRKKRKRS